MEIIQNRKVGKLRGIYSVCSANEYVIEAAFHRAIKNNQYVLIEATANQANQYGGYTGMKPKDFRDFVNSIAEKMSFPKDKIILGGDHLGMLPWKSQVYEEAMNKASELIKEYVLAGFSKIHIDSSMQLKDDFSDRLDTNIIAERAAILCKAAEEAYEELKEENPDSVHPVYVIGSVGPIPGGSKTEEDTVQITKPEEFENTVEAFRTYFYKYCGEEVWNYVIAVDVQPGVGFGDEAVHEYNREKARGLTETLLSYPNLVFEGHSTDYQTPEALKQMTEDGISILKVGPALTFALREGLIALSYIEREMFKVDAEIELSNIDMMLDYTMLKRPEYWKSYYHGTAAEVRYARRYSYLDRCRYYLPSRDVRDSIQRLIKNLKTKEIPLTLISQFMFTQYKKIRIGLLDKEPEALLRDRIGDCIDDYIYAITS